MRKAIGGWVAGLIALSTPVMADGVWAVLGGDAAKTMLGGHVVVYPNGVTQSFSVNGDTSYDSGHLQKGSWRIDGDKYCSVWPPSDKWGCYKLEVGADGKALRFTAEDGSTTDGQVVK